MLQASVSVLAEVILTGDFEKFRSLIDDAAKLHTFPERGDFSKLSANFDACLASRDCELPAFPHDFRRKRTTLDIHYTFDDDGRKGAPWMATMEHHFFQPSGCTVYQTNFRLPNDGFLYLAPESSVACPMASDVRAGTAIQDGHSKLTHDAVPGWLELPSRMLNSSLLPIQARFISWLKAYELPKKPIGTNIFYNPTYRRVDVRLTYGVDASTKIEWQIFFEPRAPDQAYVEHVIDGAWD